MWSAWACTRRSPPWTRSSACATKPRWSCSQPRRRWTFAVGPDKARRRLAAPVPDGARAGCVSDKDRPYGTGSGGARGDDRLEIAMLRSITGLAEAALPPGSSVPRSQRPHHGLHRRRGTPAARPVLLLSGNPTWCLLYRDFIRPLTAAAIARLRRTGSAPVIRTIPRVDAALTIAHHIADLVSLIVSAQIARIRHRRTGLGRAARRSALRCSA